MEEVGRFELPTLSYGFEALEPVIGTKTLEAHYGEYHTECLSTLNASLEVLREAISVGDLAKFLYLQPSLIFNGGSHLNHSLYWENLAPADTIGGELPPVGTPLYMKVKQDWGSFQKLINYFTARAVELLGNGWCWLVFDKVTKKLRFMETHDESAIMMLEDVEPLLVIDLWEHAYINDYNTAGYKKARKKYMKGIWDIVNWEVVQQRYKDLPLKRIKSRLFNLTQPK